MMFSKFLALISVIFMSQPTFASNPCHLGVKVQYAASALEMAQYRINLERKYGFHYPESLRQLKKAQENLYEAYAEKSALDFGMFNQTDCFEFLSSQHFGQKIKLEKIENTSDKIDRWLVYLNGEKLNNGNGETIEVIFNKIGYFIQAIVVPDNEVYKLIINNSITSHAGPCPCPFSWDALGNICGARSAYSITGGAEPICFPQDVSKERLEYIRRAMFKGGYLPIHSR
jgi:hypothetical protein